MRVYFTHLLLLPLIFSASGHVKCQSLFKNPLAIQQLVNQEEIKRNSIYELNGKRQQPPKLIEIPGTYNIAVSNDTVRLNFRLYSNRRDSIAITFPSDIFIVSGSDKKELTDIFLKRIQPFTSANSKGNLNSASRQDSAKNTTQIIFTDSTFNQINLPELFTSQPASSDTSNQITFKENAVALLADFTGSTPDDSVTFILRTYGFKKTTFTLKPGVFFDNLAYTPFEINAGSDETGAALFLKHELFNFGHMLFIHYNENQTRNVECLMYIPVDDFKKTMETYNPQNNDD